MEFQAGCICMQTPVMKTLLPLLLLVLACACAQVTPQQRAVVRSRAFQPLHMAEHAQPLAVPPLPVLDELVPPPPPDVELLDEEVVVEFPMVDPVFPGGSSEMYRYFSRHVIYPVVAQEMFIQGTVYVQFKVLQDGSISEPDIVRGVHESLDKEALRVVRSMPKWSPAEANGRHIAKIVVVPLHFKIL